MMQCLPIWLASFLLTFATACAVGPEKKSVSSRTSVEGEADREWSAFLGELATDEDVSESCSTCTTCPGDTLNNVIDQFIDLPPDSQVFQTCSQPASSAGSAVSQNSVVSSSSTSSPPISAAPPTNPMTTSAPVSVASVPQQQLTTSSAAGLQLGKGDGAKSCFEAVCGWFKKAPNPPPIPKPRPKPKWPEIPNPVVCKDDFADCTGPGAQAARECAASSTYAFISGMEAGHAAECVSNGKKVATCIASLAAMSKKCNMVPGGMPLAMLQGFAAKDLANCVACAAQWGGKAAADKIPGVDPPKNIAPPSGRNPAQQNPAPQDPAAPNPPPRRPQR